MVTRSFFSFICLLLSLLSLTIEGVEPKKGAPVARPKTTTIQKKVVTQPLAQKPHLAAPAKPPLDQKLILIDPGHGGYDLGARMFSCDEKSLALSTALLLKKHLTDMGYRVLLTRSRDVFVPLEKRTSIANETKAKIYISIHYNAAKNPIAKGVEVFYYGVANKGREKASKRLATLVVNNIVNQTHAENRGVKEGNFHVIRETKMPAILIEAGFMTNPDEIHLIKDINYRDKIAKGIAEGVHAYFKN